jgi:hypothetical protein
MPITSDGKEPDFTPFFHEIKEAIGKAVHNVGVVGVVVTKQLGILRIHKSGSAMHG